MNPAPLAQIQAHSHIGINYFNLRIKVRLSKVCNCGFLFLYFSIRRGTYHGYIFFTRGTTKSSSGTSGKKIPVLLLEGSLGVLWAINGTSVSTTIVLSVIVLSVNKL